MNELRINANNGIKIGPNVNDHSIHDLVPEYIRTVTLWVQRIIAAAFVILGTLKLYASGLLNFTDDSHMVSPAHLLGLIFLAGGVALFLMNEAKHRAER